MPSAALARSPVPSVRAPAGAANARVNRAARVVSRAVAEDAPPAAAVRASVAEDADAKCAETKKRLVAVAAASGRGLDATAAQKTSAAALVDALVAANPTPDPTTSELVNGDWELVYSDTHLFRSSPFFWGVGKMMGSTADFFYAAHSHQTGMFGGGVGRVVQSIDVAAGTLVSDCIVKASLGIPLLGFSPVFSGFGSVITKGRLEPLDGTRFSVVAETTTVRQDDTSVIPALNFLNGTTVPVEDAMKTVGGGEAGPEAFLDVTFLDDEMRISKLEDGSVFVYQRC